MTRFETIIVVTDTIPIPGTPYVTISYLLDDDDWAVASDHPQVRRFVDEKSARRHARTLPTHSDGTRNYSARRINVLTSNT
jgi:hypothetical protein